MRYFIIEILGNYLDKKLAFIDKPPVDLGLYDYCMARGERVGDRYPEDARIYLQPESLGIKLSSLIGNSLGCLIVNTEMKDVIVEHCDCEIEILPFTLCNHKKRVHSKDYWIINPIGSIDCLNKKASDIRYSDSDNMAVVAVRKFVLDSNKLVNAPDLFRVPEDLEQYFISERLAKAFQEHNFTNIFLLEIDQREGS